MSDESIQRIPAHQLTDLTVTKYTNHSKAFIETCSALQTLTIINDGALMSTTPLILPDSIKCVTIVNGCESLSIDPNSMVEEIRYENSIISSKRCRNNYLESQKPDFPKLVQRLSFCSLIDMGNNACFPMLTSISVSYECSFYAFAKAAPNLKHLKLLSAAPPKGMFYPEELVPCTIETLVIQSWSEVSSTFVIPFKGNRLLPALHDLKTVDLRGFMASLWPFVHARDATFPALTSVKLINPSKLPASTEHGLLADVSYNAVFAASLRHVSLSTGPLASVLPSCVQKLAASQPPKLQLSSMEIWIQTPINQIDAANIIQCMKSIATSTPYVRIVNMSHANVFSMLQESLGKAYSKAKIHICHESSYFRLKKKKKKTVVEIHAYAQNIESLSPLPLPLLPR